MSPTTITGTAAAAAGTFTLNDLRDRILTQIQNASGFTEPEVVTASSIQLVTGTPNIRDRVESRLQDSGNVRWATDDTDEAIRTALAFYSRQNPARAITTKTVTAASREVDISAITGLIRVEKVWWDYDSTTPGYPPNWRQFSVWPGAILYIDDREQPAVGDVIRIWYTKAQTLNGLDSATATTIPIEDVDVIVTGGAHFAARARAIELAEQATVDKSVVDRLKEWAEEEGKAFRYGVAQKPPAWQRYAYAYSQEDIDEGVRWALGRLNEVYPIRNETSLTLAADGREIDISSITSYVDIARVWWDYDQADPVYPPEWRDFELWPGDVLFIKDGDEPQTGDVARVFYTALRAINGLDGASTTTVPDQYETLLVTGSSGFVAQERVQEQPGYTVPTKIREWAEARTREFERGLSALSRRQGARYSGIAALPALDRWDGGGW